MVFDSSANVGGVGAAVARQKPGRSARGGSGGEAPVRLNLDWSDMGYFGTAIAVASRQWRVAGKALRDEYALGPHGPWIIHPQDGLLLKVSLVVLADLLDLSAAALLRFLRIKQDQDQASFLNELAARIAAELALAGQNGQPVRKQRGDFPVEKRLKILLAYLGAVRFVGAEEELRANERLRGDSLLILVTVLNNRR